MRNSNLLKIINSQAGFSIIQTAIIAILVLLPMMAIMSVTSFNKSRAAQAAELENIKIFKLSMRALLLNGDAFRATIEKNVEMAKCLKGSKYVAPPSACIEQFFQPFNIYRPDGEVFYKSGSGINRLGSPCDSAPSLDCPFYFDVQWAAMTSEIYPVVAIKIDLKIGTYTFGQPLVSHVFNPELFGFSLAPGKRLSDDPPPETLIYRQTRIWP